MALESINDAQYVDKVMNFRNRLGGIIEDSCRRILEAQRELVNVTDVGENKEIYNKTMGTAIQSKIESELARVDNLMSEAEATGLLSTGIAEMRSDINESGQQPPPLG